MDEIIRIYKVNSTFGPTKGLYRYHFVGANHSCFHPDLKKGLEIMRSFHPNCTTIVTFFDTDMGTNAELQRITDKWTKPRY